MNMSIFDKIDAYYDKKDKKEFYYTLLGIILAIGFIIFYFISPEATSYANKNEKKFQKFVSDINRNKNEINGLKAQNRRILEELKNMKKQLVTLNKDKVFYSQLINLLDFAKFNKTEWAQFVKNSIIDAKNQGLEVKLAENMDINKTTKTSNLSNDFISKKMNFALNLKGEYKNFIYFMYKYENTKSLIRVNKFEIKAPNEYYIEFSLYGYKL